VNGKVRMVTLLAKKGVMSVVALGVLLLAKLTNGRSSTNCLVVVAIDSRYCFQSLISSFGLSVTFRMISGSEMKFHVQCGSRDQKKWDTNSVPQSGNDVAWNAILGEKLENEIVAPSCGDKWCHESG